MNRELVSQRSSLGLINLRIYLRVSVHFDGSLVGVVLYSTTTETFGAQTGNRFHLIANLVENIGWNEKKKGKDFIS